MPSDVSPSSWTKRRSVWKTSFRHALARCLHRNYRIRQRKNAAGLFDMKVLNQLAIEENNPLSFPFGSIVRLDDTPAPVDLCSIRCKGPIGGR